MGILNKFSNWYFSKGALPYWCILLADSVIIYLCAIFGHYVHSNAMTVIGSFWQLSAGMLLSLVVYIVVFHCFHTYKGVLRFSSFVDLSRIGIAVFIASGLVWGLSLIFQKFPALAQYIILPDLEVCTFICVLGTVLMCAERVVVKTLYDVFRVRKNAKGVFIYGCMTGGVALAKSLRNSDEYVLEGFVSGDKALSGSFMLGVRVYHNEDDIVGLMKKKDAEVMLVSPVQSENFLKRTDLVDSLIKAGIKIMMMPKAMEWDGKSEISHSQLREVDIEDLLPRQKIEVDMDEIGRMLEDRRVLITGAAGSIGSEMARQVAKFAPSELVLIDQAETPMHDVRLYMARNHADLNIKTIVGSITNQEQMESIFSESKPEYVFHAAAYKHVPMMEDNPAMAVQNNVYGTRVIADLAVKYGTKKFVMISTDKAVNPTNVMGCSKRICEIYCQSLNNKLAEETAKTGKENTQFITTRFGNVLGSNGSVIPIFREQIRKGGPVTVTHPDIIRFFMLIPEACRLVLEAGTMGKGGEIFIFDMGEPVRIADLAQRMIDLSGVRDVKIQFTGLRDGEKLYEEVLNDQEQTKPTIHPKIKIASVREYPYELALENEIALHRLSYSFDDMAIVAKMKEIVPEYKSQQSKYQVLDK